MTKECSTCRQLNPPDAAFCLNCAAPLSAQQFSGNPQSAGPNFGAAAERNSISPPNSGASQRAIIALVLTIAGLFCCGPLTSIPASIVGWMEIDAIKKGQSPTAGMWMAQVGLWGGIVVTIITSVGGVLFLLLSAASSDVYYY